MTSHDRGGPFVGRFMYTYIAKLVSKVGAGPVVLVLVEACLIIEILDGCAETY
jgi:hypothetical protein